MEKILKDTYTYVSNDDDYAETELFNFIFENNNFDNIKKLTNDVLERPLNEQIHFIYRTIAKFYKLSEESEEMNKIQNFLGQKTFEDHRDIIMAFVDNGDNDDVTPLEKRDRLDQLEIKFNIKLIDGDVENEKLRAL